MALIGAGAGIAVILFIIQQGSGVPCLIRFLLRIPCPGCGLTRSIIALSYGDLLTSLRFHPLGSLAALLCILVSLAVLADVLSPTFPRFPRTARLTSHHRVIAGLGILMVMVWAVRVLLHLQGNTFFRW